METLSELDISYLKMCIQNSRDQETRDMLVNTNAMVILLAKYIEKEAGDMFTGKKEAAL